MGRPTPLATLVSARCMLWLTAGGGKLTAPWAEARRRAGPYAHALGVTFVNHAVLRADAAAREETSSVGADRKPAPLSPRASFSVPLPRDAQLFGRLPVFEMCGLLWAMAVVASPPFGSVGVRRAAWWAVAGPLAEGVGACAPCSRHAAAAIAAAVLSAAPSADRAQPVAAARHRRRRVPPRARYPCAHAPRSLSPRLYPSIVPPPLPRHSWDEAAPATRCWVERTGGAAASRARPSPTRHPARHRRGRGAGPPLPVEGAGGCSSRA